MDATAIFLAEFARMNVIPANVNKTISPADLDRPEVAGPARALNQLGRQLWWNLPMHQ